MNRLPINQMVWEGYAEILPHIEELVHQLDEDGAGKKQAADKLTLLFLEHIKKTVRRIKPNFQVLRYTDVEQFAAVKLIEGITKYSQIKREKRIPLRAYLERSVCAGVLNDVIPFNKPIRIPAGTVVLATSNVKQFKGLYPTAGSPQDIPPNGWRMTQSKETIARSLWMVSHQPTIPFHGQDEEYAAMVEESTENVVLTTETRFTINSALDTLPEEERSCVVDVYINEETIEEVASKMRASPAWVRKKIQDGLTKIQKHMGVTNANQTDDNLPSFRKKLGGGKPHKLNITLKELLEHPDLTEREKTVIIGRENLNGMGDKTLQQLSDDIKCTRENIRQIEAKAHRKLNDFMVCDATELHARKFIQDLNEAVYRACNHRHTKGAVSWKADASRARAMIVAKHLPADVQMDAVVANIWWLGLSRHVNRQNEREN